MTTLHVGDRVTIEHPSCSGALTMVGVNLDTGELILQPAEGRALMVHPSQVAKIATPSPLHRAQPRARNTDPDASHEAAEHAAMSAEKARDELLCAHYDAGARGMTGDDIRRVFGVDAYEKVGPRRPDLERAGLVEKARDVHGDHVKRDRKGVYRITASGIAEVFRLREVAS